MIEFLQSLELNDIIEIIFFSTIIYYFSIWLKRDQNKKLLFIFYCYFVVTIVSQYLYLPTITQLLTINAPIALIIFIILHQERLQKNFVMFKQAPSQKNIDNNWTDELIRLSIGALYNNKEFVAVIERTDNLSTLLETSCIFNADIKRDIFNMCIDKHINSNNSIIWFNQLGKLVAINASWKFNIEEQWITKDAQAINKWKQDGLFITSKTDACIFKITPLTHSFDIIIQGKLKSDLSPEQASTIIKLYLNNSYKNTKIIKEEGGLHNQQQIGQNKSQNIGSLH